MSQFFDLNDSQPELISPHPRRQETLPAWRRLLGRLSLMAAAGLTVAAVLLIVAAPPSPEANEAAEAAAPDRPTPTSPPDPTPADAPPTARENADPNDPPPAELPTLSGGQIAKLLAIPPEPIDEDRARETIGASFDPFTIIPHRTRSRMTRYTVARGDTMDAIAARFGLSRETLAWCNDYRLALVLHPGDQVTIPPADGACHTVLATQGKDIRAIAAQYNVDDPYAIIDAAANDLPDIAPETLLPSATFLFIPGGQGSIITWDAPVEQDAAGNVIAFAPGQAGSCGAVAGGGTFWTNPLPNGAFVRGFYAGHSGIDISAATGTPILAANGGPVLYAGWNSWGYGNTVVIGHGPFSTLYGHMSSLAVRCGQRAAAGQVIGYVGSTGNSSGPHLHFEIRHLNQPQDPRQTPAIGW